MELVKSCSNNSFKLIFLVANKLDIVKSEPEKRAITFEHALDLANKYEAKYLECSVLDDLNVIELFDEVIEDCLKNELF